MRQPISAQKKSDDMTRPTAHDKLPQQLEEAIDTVQDPTREAGYTTEQDVRRSVGLPVRYRRTRAQRARQTPSVTHDSHA